MTKKASSKKSTLTLHGLLGALSLWGTAARGFLFGFLALAVFVTALSETTSDVGIDIEVMVLVYVLGSFLLLDLGYVLISRAYLLQGTLDRLALYIADIFLATLYFVPNLVVSSRIQLTVDPLMFVVFVPIVVLSLRMLVGMLFGSKR